MRVFTNGRECVGDNGDKQVDEPEIQDDETDDEEKTRDEELGVHHSVHEWRPLFNIFVSI